MDLDMRSYKKFFVIFCYNYTGLKGESSNQSEDHGNHFICIHNYRFPPTTTGLSLLIIFVWFYYMAKLAPIKNNCYNLILQLAPSSSVPCNWASIGRWNLKLNQFILPSVVYLYINYDSLISPWTVHEIQTISEVLENVAQEFVLHVSCNNFFISWTHKLCCHDVPVETKARVEETWKKMNAGLPTKLPKPVMHKLGSSSKPKTNKSTPVSLYKFFTLILF